VVDRVELLAADRGCLGIREDFVISITTTFPYWKPEAVFGRRPRYSVWTPTSALVIAAFRSPL